MRRIPRQHRAPIVQVACGVSLVPPAPDTRLDKDRLKGGLADMVRRWSPCLHLFDEDGEGALDGSLDAHVFTDDGFCDEV